MFARGCIFSATIQGWPLLNLRVILFAGKGASTGIMGRRYTLHTQALGLVCGHSGGEG
jgi:hypothetical protein